MPLGLVFHRLSSGFNSFFHFSRFHLVVMVLKIKPWFFISHLKKVFFARHFQSKLFQKDSSMNYVQVMMYLMAFIFNPQLDVDTAQGEIKLIMGDLMSDLNPDEKKMVVRKLSQMTIDFNRCLELEGNNYSFENVFTHFTFQKKVWVFVTYKMSICTFQTTLNLMIASLIWKSGWWRTFWEVLCPKFFLIRPNADMRWKCGEILTAFPFGKCFFSHRKQMGQTQPNCLTEFTACRANQSARRQQAVRHPEMVVRSKRHLSTSNGAKFATDISSVCRLFFGHRGQMLRLDISYAAPTEQLISVAFLQALLCCVAMVHSVTFWISGKLTLSLSGQPPAGWGIASPGYTIIGRWFPSGFQFHRIWAPMQMLSGKRSWLWFLFDDSFWDYFVLDLNSCFQLFSGLLDTFHKITNLPWAKVREPSSLYHRPERPLVLFQRFQNFDVQFAFF